MLGMQWVLRQGSESGLAFPQGGHSLSYLILHRTWAYRLVLMVKAAHDDQVLARRWDSVVDLEVAIKRKLAGAGVGFLGGKQILFLKRLLKLFALAHTAMMLPLLLPEALLRLPDIVLTLL